jgi:two-component system CheB/CheR fusion protein
MQADPQQPSLRVLVVDDCHDTTYSMSILLRYWGHEVRIASDGNAGLEEALSFMPDVIILDIGLPGIDGWQLAERLRDLPGFEKTLLLAMSGYGQTRDFRRSSEAGFDQHLVKPLDLQELQRLLAIREKTLVHVGLLATI